MTIEARYNLQKGVPEDRRNAATTYTSDGSLSDEYILAKVQIKQKFASHESSQKDNEKVYISKELQQNLNNIVKQLLI